MNPQKLLVVTAVALVSILLLQGCAAVTEPPRAQAPTPVATIKPEIDHSDSSPDCQTAAQRIAANVIVGMPMSEVLRLVGKPEYRFPGSWWWSSSFDKSGKPFVQYDAVSSSASNSRVTKISADSEGC